MSVISEKINRDFPAKKIVVVGDLVADQFLHGMIDRISREAPVFILRHEKTKTLPGGAANAAANVASFGGKSFLVGLLGKDSNGEALLQSLKDSSVNCESVIVSEKFTTTTKVRVLAGQHYAARQQVIRIDYENKSPVDAELKKQLVENFRRISADADAIIISDYNYGVTTPEVFETAKNICASKNIPLLIDSRYRLQEFPEATSGTPNEEEVERILGGQFDEKQSFEKACADLCNKLGYQSLLVTRGNKGMLLVEKSKNPLHLSAVGAKEPVDVTGAGDTVIAVYGLALASGLSFAEAANLANHAGGIVVMKKGTASVSAQELLNSLLQKEKAETGKP